MQKAKADDKQKNSPSQVINSEGLEYPATTGLGKIVIDRLRGDPLTDFEQDQVASLMAEVVLQWMQNRDMDESSTEAA